MGPGGTHIHRPTLELEDCSDGLTILQAETASAISILGMIRIWRDTVERWLP